MATRNKNQTPDTPDTPDTTAADLLALLAAATQEADALTPRKRSKGPKKIRTYFDTDLILSTAKTTNGDWLDLLAALNIDNEGDDGPKIRTRLSQLINAGRLSPNFTPRTPGETPLYLATKKMDAIRAQLLAMGIDPAAATLSDAIDAQNATETADDTGETAETPEDAA